MGLILLLSQGDRPLIGAARRLLDENQPGAAVVVAQAAVETGLEQSLQRALRRANVDTALADWITAKAQRGVTYSPKSDSVQSLWYALTGDRLSDHDWWGGYLEGIRLRDNYAHTARVPAANEAARFIDRAEQAATHIRETTTYA